MFLPALVILHLQVPLAFLHLWLVHHHIDPTLQPYDANRKTRRGITTEYRVNFLGMYLLGWLGGSPVIDKPTSSPATKIYTYLVF